MEFVAGTTTEYGLTLGSLAVGTTTATLSSGYWNLVSGIRVGCRIQSDDGGLATVTSTEFYQEGSVDIIITKEFGSLSYTYDEWQIVYPEYSDLISYLPEFLREKPILVTYLESLRDTIVDRVADSINRYDNIRDWQLMDKEYLKLSGELLGFFNDISSSFDETLHRRFLKDLSYFYEISGTKNYVEFLSHILGSSFDRYWLYTDDYETFSRTQTGNAYLTKRIDLDFNIEEFPSPDDLGALARLFYYVAPITIVVNSFVGNTVGFTEFEVTENSVLNYDLFSGAFDTVV